MVDSEDVKIRYS